MKLTIVRHGETEENKAGILQGQLPGALSEAGIAQVQYLANRLKDHSFDIVYSSNTGRAKLTTQEIIKYHPYTDVVYMDELNDHCHGEFEGQKKSDCEDYLLGKIKSKKGESLEQVIDRVQFFYDKILVENKDHNVLIISHRLINKILDSFLSGRDLDSIKYQNNAAVDIFEIDENQNFRHLVKNCTSHLKSFYELK